MSVKLRKELSEKERQRLLALIQQISDEKVGKQEPFINKLCVSEKQCEHDKNVVLDKIRAEIREEYNRLSATRADETLELGECLGLKISLKIIDKYREREE